jgi:hypothetical protein
VHALVEVDRLALVTTAVGSGKSLDLTASRTRTITRIVTFSDGWKTTIPVSTTDYQGALGFGASQSGQGADKSYVVIQTPWPGWAATTSRTYTPDGPVGMAVVGFQGEGQIATDIQLGNTLVAEIALFGDLEVEEGKLAEISSQVHDPHQRPYDPFHYLWKVVSNNGDTVPQGEGKDFSFTPGDNGLYRVKLFISDKDSGLAAYPAEIQVTSLNMAPSLEAGVDQTVKEGQIVSLAASFSDPGILDTHTAMIDWGDGIVEAGQVTEEAGAGVVSGTHVYADDGLYPVVVTLTDDDGASVSDSLTVTVSNMAPVLSTSGTVRAVDEGIPSKLERSITISKVTVWFEGWVFTDKGTLDTHTATIDWGDGTVEAGNVVEQPFGPPGSTAGMSGTIQGSHVYADNGTYTVKVTVTDDNGGMKSRTVSAIVNNLPPAVADDAYTVDEDVTKNVNAPGVLGNDRDVPADPLTAELLSGVSHGTLKFNSDGSFVYTPTLNFNGTDTFTYLARDDEGAASSVATVTITVMPVNDRPVAVDDTAVTDEDVPLTIYPSSLLRNDYDVDGDLLQVTQVKNPVNGTVTLSPLGGSIVFTPSQDFNGSASFEYVVSDGKKGTDTGLVTILVNPVNDPPVAVDDTAVTDEDVPLTILASSLLANDYDIDGDELKITEVGNALNGTVVLNGEGNPVFTPSSNFNGRAAFDYTISDGHGGESKATVMVTVNPVNDAPVARNDSYLTGMNAALEIGAQGGLMNVSNLDPELLYGLGTILYADFGASYGLWQYDGKVWTQLSPKDAQGMTGVGSTLFLDFGKDGIWQYTSSGGLAQVPGGQGTWDADQLYGLGSYLYADFGSRGLQRYDPKAGWVSISAMDAEGMTGVGTANLYVDFGRYGIYRYVSSTGTLSQVSTKNPEQLFGLGSYLYADFGAGIGAGLQRYDPKGGWVSIIAMDAQGMTGVGTTLFVDFGKDGIWQYTTIGGLAKVPGDQGSWDADQLYGLGSYLYADFGTEGLWRYDGQSWVSLSNLDVQAMAGVPTSTPILYADAGSSGLYRYINGVLANDSDVEGDLLSAVLVSGPKYGGLTLNSDGSFTYTPNAGFTGKDSFTYRASDGVDQGSTATVNITVNPPMGMKALTASSAPISTVSTPLAPSDLAPMVVAAIDLWRSSSLLEDSLLSRLPQVSFQIADLPGLTLGLASSNEIWIDVNAAGYGWFIDSTPFHDSELREQEKGTATRMDLFTVVAHELGHVLGFSDQAPGSDELMSATLSSGERHHLPDSAWMPLVQMEKSPQSSSSSLGPATPWLLDFLLDGVTYDHPNKKIQIVLD